MNRVVPILVLTCCALLPRALQGQTLRIGKGAAITADRSRGHAAYPASALQSAGARLVATPAGARLLLADDTLEFMTGSPFFRSRAGIVQLAFAVYGSGARLMLPRGFFIDWLPRALRSGFAYDATSGTLSPSGIPALGAASSPKRDSVAASGPRAARDSTAPASAGTNRGTGTQRVVIIDAGHGGKDPGKPGPNGVLEKNAALTVATRLAGFLRERNYEVHLTRSTDTLIALADRPRMANDWKNTRAAALFISIHANSGVSQAHGFETYFLSDALTEDERRVAEMENAAVRYEDRRPENAPELDQVLSGLRNDYYLRASNDFAETIQRSLATVHPGPNRGVKRAGFVVLVGALMPAALVELAFISNPEEAKLLGTSAFQQKIAWSLAQAIEQFFETHQHLWAEVQR